MKNKTDIEGGAMSLHSRIWCAECRLRIALAEPTELFRNNVYHKRCLIKRRLQRARAAEIAAAATEMPEARPAQRECDESISCS